jgi:hypothetical protein
MMYFYIKSGMRLDLKVDIVGCSDVVVAAALEVDRCPGEVLRSWTEKSCNITWIQ